MEALILVISLYFFTLLVDTVFNLRGAYSCRLSYMDLDLDLIYRNWDTSVQE